MLSSYGYDIAAHHRPRFELGPMVLRTYRVPENVAGQKKATGDGTSRVQSFDRGRGEVERMFQKLSKSCFIERSARIA